MLSFSPFGESSGKQQVRLECWKLERTANVASWIKRWFWWFTIWMSGRLGKVVSLEHKEMPHSPKAQHIYMSKYLLPRTQRVVFKCVHMDIYSRKQYCNELWVWFTFLYKILISGSSYICLTWWNTGRFYQMKCSIHCLLKILPCSWSLVLLPSCFFWWQVWLWVVGRRVDVYRE